MDWGLAALVSSATISHYTTFIGAWLLVFFALAYIASALAKKHNWSANFTLGAVITIIIVLIADLVGYAILYSWLYLF